MILKTIKASRLRKFFSIVYLSAMRPLSIIIFLLSAIVISECGITSDVDVFNKNFNRRLHSSKDSTFFGSPGFPFKHPEPSWKASSTLSSDNAESSMSGEITFKQWDLNAPVLVSFNISGLPAGKHSVHIHSFGDLSEGCKSTGPHFRSAIIGNIETKDGEDFEATYEILGLNLFGFSGILGRSVVVHEKSIGKILVQLKLSFIFKLIISDHLRYPDLFRPDSIFFDNAVSYQTEEDTVGERLACGVITIVNNVNNM